MCRACSTSFGLNVVVCCVRVRKHYVCAVVHIVHTAWVGSSIHIDVWPLAALLAVWIRLVQHVCCVSQLLCKPGC